MQLNSAKTLDLVVERDEFDDMFINNEKEFKGSMLNDTQLSHSSIFRKSQGSKKSSLLENDHSVSDLVEGSSDSCPSYSKQQTTIKKLTSDTDVENDEKSQGNKSVSHIQKQLVETEVTYSRMEGACMSEKTKKREEVNISNQRNLKKFNCKVKDQKHIQKILKDRGVHLYHPVGTLILADTYINKQVIVHKTDCKKHHRKVYGGSLFDSSFLGKSQGQSSISM